MRMLIGLLVLMTFFVAGCGLFDGTRGGDDGDVVAVTEEAPATPELEPQATPDLEAQATPDLQPQATPDLQPQTTPEPGEPLPTDETGLPVVNLANPMPFQSADGAYGVSASYARVDAASAAEEAPAGRRWVLTTVTLMNNEGATVSVEADHLYLIGRDGVRYPAGQMIERAEPQLVGAVLNVGESVYGFAVFAFPENVEPVLFEWCPAGNCGQAPLQTPIIFQPS